MSNARKRSIKYADDVISGKIVACEHIKLAAQRFKTELKKKNWRWIFDDESADRAVDFFPEVLSLAGPSGFVPFELFDWQCFLVANLYGWVDKKDKDIRRFRKAFVLCARGGGKSPTAAGISIYHTFFLKNPVAKSFIIATNLEQSAQVMNAAAEMVELINTKRNEGNKFKTSKVREHALSARFDNNGKNQVLKKFASETSGKGASGLISDMICADECQEYRSSATLDRLMSSMKRDKPTPLLFAICNAGVSGESPAWEMYQMSKRNLNPSDKFDDDRMFSLIYEVDPQDKPLEDVKCWGKAAPSLKYGVPSMDLFKEQVSLAKGNPVSTSEVERALFCRWVSASSPWITYENFTQNMCGKYFNKQLKFPEDEELQQMRCYAALDLSVTTDLSAVTLCWIDKNKHIYGKTMSWLPAEDIEKKSRLDNQPYVQWVKAGYIILTDGKVVKYSEIAEWVIEQYEKYKIRCLAYDSYRIAYFLAACKEFHLPFYLYGENGTGIECRKHWQGFKQSVKENDPDLHMGRSIQLLEERLLNKKITLESNPLLVRAATGSELMIDPNENRKFSKATSTCRIDPVVSLAMAVGAADKFNGKTTQSEAMEHWLGLKRAQINNN